MKNKVVKTIKYGVRKSLTTLKPNVDLSVLAKNNIGKNKTIIITGASSGLGAEMTRVFARLGYNLGICARRTDRLESLKATLNKQYPDIKIEVKQLDVSDYDAVFTTFKAFNEQFGHIDRIIVNAGVGDGRSIGKGNFDINRRTAEINFISALAQCEAAMHIFRAQNSGHLVIISSMAAIRGMPKHLTAYSASKAAVAHMAEGIRAEMIKSNLPIDVTTIFPGYIRTEMNEGAAKLPFEVDVRTGTNAMVAAIEAGVVQACVPSMPWTLIGKAMKVLPLDMVNKIN